MRQCVSRSRGRRRVESPLIAIKQSAFGMAGKGRVHMHCVTSPHKFLCGLCIRLRRKCMLRRKHRTDQYDYHSISPANMRLPDTLKDRYTPYPFSISRTTPSAPRSRNWYWSAIHAYVFSRPSRRLMPGSHPRYCLIKALSLLRPFTPLGAPGS